MLHPIYKERLKREQKARMVIFRINKERDLIINRLKGVK